LKKHKTCPCCGYVIFRKTESSLYEICYICYWEDDPYKREFPDLKDGENNISLRQAQLNFLKFGACSREMIGKARKPNDQNKKDPKFKLIS